MTVTPASEHSYSNAVMWQGCSTLGTVADTRGRGYLSAMAYWLQGLDVGNCDIILHVRVCEGLMRQLDGSIEKRFARKELMYPIQVCTIPSIPI